MAGDLALWNGDTAIFSAATFISLHFLLIFTLGYSFSVMASHVAFGDVGYV